MLYKNVNAGRGGHLPGLGEASPGKTGTKSAPPKPQKTISHAMKDSDAEEARLKPKKKTSSGTTLQLTSVEDIPEDRELSRVHEVSLTRRGSTGIL